MELQAAMSAHPPVTFMTEIGLWVRSKAWLIQNISVPPLPVRRDPPIKLFRDVSITSCGKHCCFICWDRHREWTGGFR